MYNRKQPDPNQYPGPSGLDYASFGLNLLGTGMGAYGTYLAAEQADEEYRDAKRRYEQEMDLMRTDRKDAQQQQGMQNNMSAGNYARDLEKDVYGSYSPWRRKVGL